MWQKPKNNSPHQYLQVLFFEWPNKQICWMTIRLWEQQLIAKLHDLIGNYYPLIYCNVLINPSWNSNPTNVLCSKQLHLCCLCIWRCSKIKRWCIYMWDDIVLILKKSRYDWAVWLLFHFTHLLTCTWILKTRFFFFQHLHSSVLHLSAGYFHTLLFFVNSISFVDFAFM